MMPGPAAPRRPWFIGGWLLFLLPLPLALRALSGLWQGDLGSALAGLVPFLVLLAGGLLTRRGLAQAKTERALGGPPFKTIGAGVVGLGTALAASLGAGHALPVALAFGLAALLGCYLAYGFERRPAFSQDKDVGAALAEAYRKLDELAAASRTLGARDLRQRLERIIAWGERILERIAEDPEAFRQARKFLNVYLDGARQVTAKYARAQAAGSADQLDANFRTLLEDLEAVSAEQYERLLEHDLVALDVQMEVLTTRLKREGVL